MTSFKNTIRSWHNENKWSGLKLKGEKKTPTDAGVFVVAVQETRSVFYVKRSLAFVSGSEVKGSSVKDLQIYHSKIWHWLIVLMTL